MEQGRFIIYGLKDPESGELRYIGQSTRALKRPEAHWNDRRLLNDGLHVHNWCKTIVERGKFPTIEIMEIFSGDGDPQMWLNEREIYWIAKKRRQGCRLTNLNDGGGGNSNPAPEIRERMRKAKLGKLHKHPDGTAEKISKTMKGNKNGSSNLGKKRTEEQRALIAQRTSEATKKWWAERKERENNGLSR